MGKRSIKIMGDQKIIEKSLWSQLPDAEGFFLPEAFAYFVQSMQFRLGESTKVMVGYSGGKDSTATVAAVVHAVDNGLIDLKPEQVYITYSDTRQELPPLHDNAVAFLQYLANKGYQTRMVQPKLDKRFWVQMIGRGLPKPWALSRWCVTSLKVGPMGSVVREMYQANGNQKIIVVTGVRKGESTARDVRIDTICSKDGECGTGMWQEEDTYYNRLAPILAWRPCHVFDMLHGMDTGFPRLPIEVLQFTSRVAKIYGDEDIRTGCNGCPVAAEDHALKRVVERMPEYGYLAPILKLRQLWDVLADPMNRHLRLLNDGSAKSQSTDLGPYTFEARAMILEFVNKLQEEINTLALASGVRLEDTYQMINAEERERIQYHWDAKTWPTGWDGTQPVGDLKQLVKKRTPKGQVSMFSAEEDEAMFAGVSELELFGE